MQRILIVEDEPEIAQPLEDDLRLEGYEVEVARDGHAGAARGKDPGFDLILLDVMLPGKDGFDVCREIRKAGVRTPILFLTAIGRIAGRSRLRMRECAGRLKPTARLIPA